MYVYLERSLFSVLTLEKVELHHLVEYKWKKKKNDRSPLGNASYSANANRQIWKIKRSHKGMI